MKTNNLGDFALFTTIVNLYKSLPEINFSKILPDINLQKYLQPQSPEAITGTGDYDISYNDIFNWFVNAGCPPETIQPMWVETWLSEARLVGKTQAYKELVAGWQAQARNAVLAKVGMGIGALVAGYLVYRIIKRRK